MPVNIFSRLVQASKLSKVKGFIRKTMTQHHKATGLLIIRFKGNERMDIPDLTIEKFHIMEDIGPSYKFAFNQAYVGMIIWARKVNFHFRTKIEVPHRFLLWHLILDPAFLRLSNPKVIWQRSYFYWKSLRIELSDSLCATDLISVSNWGIWIGQDDSPRPEVGE